ncbi:hypothetical protein, partial [Frankia sp. CeD]|uniref:hypothetical protein n=1 Tax=Frankia sp. CeD TaxID=258230 RepID=UPI001F411DAC
RPPLPLPNPDPSQPVGRRPCRDHVRITVTGVRDAWHAEEFLARRRAVTDTDLPLLDRVAATLILLYSYALSGGP